MEVCSEAAYRGNSGAIYPSRQLWCEALCNMMELAAAPSWDKSGILRKMIKGDGDKYRRIHQQNCRDPEVPAQSQICIRHHQGLEHTPASNSQVSFIYTVQDIKIILNYGRNYEVTGWIKIPP